MWMSGDQHDVRAFRRGAQEHSVAISDETGGLDLVQPTTLVMQVRHTLKWRIQISRTVTLMF